MHDVAALYRRLPTRSSARRSSSPTPEHRIDYDCCLLLADVLQCAACDERCAAPGPCLALACFRLVSRAETKETRGKPNQAIDIARGAFPTTRTLVLCAAQFLLSLPLPLSPHLPHLPLPYRTVPIETHNSHRRSLSPTRAPATQAAPLAYPARL
jgi:hypothetical protein